MLIGSMKEYNAYIFDLDGTLLDTLGDLASSVNYALRAYGMPEHDIEDIRWFVGNGVRNLMARSVPEGDTNPRFEEVYDTFRKHYMEHSFDTTGPYSGILDLLSCLKHRKKKIAVVSNKFYTATQELCRHFFGYYVDVAIGERDNIRRKPAPDTVIEAMSQLGVSSDETVYIGDSDVDVATAKNSGLPCISVLWGFRDKDFLEKHGASTFISEPSELLMWE